MKASVVFVLFAVIAPLYVTYVTAANCTAMAPSKAVAGYNPVFNADPSQTYYASNTLTVSINGPMVATRNYTNATISGASSVGCSSISGSFWKVQYGGNTTSCQDIITLTLPWVNHTACGFNQTGNDGSFLYFKGKIILSYQEQAGNFSGSPVYRQAVHNYVVFISFPLTLTVSTTNITVNSNIPLDVALTSEKFNADTGVLYIQFTAGLPYSSMLNGTVWLATPGSIGGSAITIDNTLCTTVSGSVCLQVLGFNLTNNNVSNCVFNGDYHIYGYQVACRENGGVGCSSSPVDIQFTLDSGNLCPQVGLTPQLTGSLAAYTSTSFSAAVGNFNLGDQVFFKVTTNTGIGNTVALVFVNVTFSDGVNTFPLITNAANTATATAATINVNNAGGYFSLYLSGSVFQNAIGATSTYTFTAICQATFAGNRKRNVEFTWDPEGEQVLTSTRIELTDPEANLEIGEEEDIYYEDEQVGANVDNAIAFATNIAGAVLGVAVTVMVVAVYKKLTRRSL